MVLDFLPPIMVPQDYNVWPDVHYPEPNDGQEHDNESDWRAPAA